jgi:hypothetical protein
MYPRGYAPSAVQPGAGQIPMQLVEVEAVVRAMTARSNICISFSYHTTGREILHVCETSAALMSSDDRRRTLALVDRCCEVTGYGIRPRLSGGGNGHSLTWGYEHRGHVAFIQEMWSVMDAAGIAAPGHLTTPVRPLPVKWPPICGETPGAVWSLVAADRMCRRCWRAAWRDARCEALR